MMGDWAKRRGPTILWAIGFVAVAACGGPQASGDNGEDGTGETSSAVRASAGGQAQVIASGGLHLRSGPSTGSSIILTMPNGSIVDVVGASGAWDSVRYNGTTGWAYATYLSAVSKGGGGGGTGGGGGGGATGPVADAIARAESGLGFSYHWGGGCWSPGSSAIGACYGSCPSCTHSGTWGADCSGYVSKIWQVPGAEDVTRCDHPLNTTSFYDDPTDWRDVPRSSVMKGDAFVRHGHIFLFDHGDPWGALYAYEAKGCSYGIVHDNRTADSTYKVIRRNGFN